MQKPERHLGAVLCKGRRAVHSPARRGKVRETFRHVMSRAHWVVADCAPRNSRLQGQRVGHSRQSAAARSEEHTSELQSLMRISYAVFCLKKKNTHNNKVTNP